MRHSTWNTVNNKFDNNINNIDFFFIFMYIFGVQIRVKAYETVLSSSPLETPCYRMLYLISKHMAIVGIFILCIVKPVHAIY